MKLHILFVPYDCTVVDRKFFFKVIEHNQNVEKLETLGKILAKKVDDLSQTKEEVIEDLAKIIQVHTEAVKLHQKITQDGSDN